MNMIQLDSHVKNTEVHAVAMQLSLAFSESELQNDINLSRIFANLDEKIELITKAVKYKIQKSELGKKDKERDSLIRGIWTSVEAASFSLDSKIESATAIIQKVLDRYASMQRKSYDIESSLVKAFLQDLKGELLQEAIVQIPFLPDLIARLEASQEEFYESQIARSAEKSMAKSTATTLKRELLSIINNQVVCYLTAISSIEDSYEELYRIVRGYILKMNADVKKRVRSGR